MYKKYYYYVHTGHRIGLDRFRRAVCILNKLDKDITLLTSDYRIAQTSKEFSIQNSVGIDVVRNIPQIANNGDVLIFDSDEANPLMLEDMKQYFSAFYHMKNDTVAVADKYFEAASMEKTVKISYFFGDDDYEKDLQKHIEFVEELNPHLQLGFYYFLDYEDMLKKRFSNYFEFEEYDDMIMKSEIVITSSPQAILESLAAGAKPIYFKRADYVDDFDELFLSLNIPIIENYDKTELIKIIKTISNIKYKKIPQNCNKLIKFINLSLNL
jgi:hypothetical protein